MCTMAGGLIVSFYAVWTKDIVVFEANIYMNEFWDLFCEMILTRNIIYNALELKTDDVCLQEISQK